jgi:DNA-binding transcriptional regulator YhcF (GntR family)
MITPRPGGSLYEQIAAAVRADILTGRLQPGQRIPSELALQQVHGVARETVRRAIGLLRQEGLVVVQRGHGVVVREQLDRQTLTPLPGATIISRMPTDEERAAHDLPDGVPVLWVVAPDGSAAAYPADRWVIVYPPIPSD